MVQKIKTHPVATVLITLVIALVVLVILGGYIFNWDWTGLGTYTGPSHNSSSDYQRGKTFWDWMQLLFIPVVLAVAGFWYNHRERKVAELRAEAEREIEQKRAEADREISFDNQREAALKEYIDKISELLLHENLRRSERDAEVQTIARVRTLRVLPRLDSTRKRSIVEFLKESELIIRDKSIVILSGADLRKADLTDTNLIATDLLGANLMEAKLMEAELREAKLWAVNLIGADLTEADLTAAELVVARLMRANFTNAIITEEQLKTVKTLKGAIMRDGSIHP